MKKKDKQALEAYSRGEMTALELRRRLDGARHGDVSCLLGLSSTDTTTPASASMGPACCSIGWALRSSAERQSAIERSMHGLDTRAYPLHHEACALLAEDLRPYNMSMAKGSKTGTAEMPKEKSIVKPEPSPVPKPPPKTAAKKPTARRPKKPNPARIEEIFRRFAAANPEPLGELNSVNTYTLLVAVVLSAQATDAGVNKATKPLFAIADSPEKMLALGEEKLREMIKTIGLFRMKAKNVIALSERLVKDFGGEVPRTREQLETLPGVGRKTANVVLNIAFSEPTIAVDTHIFRVSNRIPLVTGKTPFEIERGLEAIVPDAYKRHAHHWLILHGRYICKALRPECGRCLINDLCEWPGKRLPA